ncbi:hypothetical protein D516_2821 [Rhodobacter sp. AKP1]|nr:hypothetical protein D516_2821 [Rhodobacter sp. AKP1]
MGHVSLLLVRRIACPAVSCPPARVPVRSAPAHPAPKAGATGSPAQSGQSEGRLCLRGLCPQLFLRPSAGKRPPRKRERGRRDVAHGPQRRPSA